MVRGGKNRFPTGLRVLCANGFQVVQSGFPRYRKNEVHKVCLIFMRLHGRKNDMKVNCSDQAMSEVR